MAPSVPDGPRSLQWSLRRANQRFRLAVFAALGSCGCGDLPRPGMWVVSALAEGEVSAAELAVVMGITKQAVSQVVTQLVSLGYVTRQRDPTDARRRVLRLTARGRDAAQVVTTVVADLEGTLATRLGAEELEHLRSLLDAVPEVTPVAQPKR